MIENAYSYIDTARKQAPSRPTNKSGDYAPRIEVSTKELRGQDGSLIKCTSTVVRLRDRSAGNFMARSLALRATLDKKTTKAQQELDRWAMICAPIIAKAVSSNPSITKTDLLRFLLAWRGTQGRTLSTLLCTNFTSHKLDKLLVRTFLGKEYPALVRKGRGAKHGHQGK
jgi:hypothetical protein